MKRNKPRSRWAVMAERPRYDLIQVLGGRCAFCHGLEQLEIDHVNGRAYRLEKLSSHMRAKKYWLEYANGVALRVLCRSCNAGYDPRDAQQLEEAPF